MRARGREVAPTGQKDARRAPRRLNAAVLWLYVTYALRAWMRWVRSMLTDPDAGACATRLPPRRARIFSPHHVDHVLLTPSELGTRGSQNKVSRKVSLNSCVNEVSRESPRREHIQPNLR